MMNEERHAGVLHFSHNPNCEPAAFLANFATKDPGTQTMWNSMMRIPAHILHSATGIDENTIRTLKSYPLVTAPGTGEHACSCTNSRYAYQWHQYTLDQTPQFTRLQAMTSDVGQGIFKVAHLYQQPILHVMPRQRSAGLGVSS